ncbi:MAG: patatin-like phospholipase family protein [Blastocatellales bacterium]
MNKELFDQIVTVLQPDMGDAGDRKALVESALIGSPVLQKISWAGAARPFTIQLVRLLIDFGTLRSGRPAIVALLEEVRQQVGADRQKELDQILAQLGATGSDDGEPNSAKTPEIKRTIATGHPEIETANLAQRTPAPISAEHITPASITAAVSIPASNSKQETSFPVNETVRTPRWPRLKPFRPKMLVMKGGGVKGIAYVGALEVLEQYGYSFNHFVGTSAGAITAALLAVGYSSQELEKILAETDFRQFKDGWLPLSLPLLWLTKGLYEGEKFRVWLENKLRQKFKKYPGVAICFEHLKHSDGQSPRLTVFASRQGQTSYAFDSETHSEEEISFACRCSMAIPYFFKPEKIGGKWVVDGGMQNNYPIDALLKYFPELRDSNNFIGLYLGPKQAEVRGKWMLLNLLSIWQESGDEESKREFIDRTIVIDPRPVKTTDFSLSKNDIAFLLGEGRASALRWVYEWSDGERPALSKVEAAEQEAERLRGVTIDERFRRFWRKVAFTSLLAGLLIVVGYFLWHL